MSKRGPIYRGKNGISFYEYTSWAHRYKVLTDDGKIVSKKKKGYRSEEESDTAYYIHDEEFKQKLKEYKELMNKDMTFKEYLVYWFEKIHCHHLKFQTEIIQSYVLYNLIVPNIEYDIKLKLVTASYLDGIIQKSFDMINYGGIAARSLIITAFTEAQNRGFIVRNVAYDTKFYERPKPNVQVLNTRQLKRFLVGAQTTNWYLEILLALFCGLRKGEILAVKFRDFDFNNKTLRIERQLVRKGEREKNTNHIKFTCLVEDYPKTVNGVRTIRVPNLIFEELLKRKEQVEKDKNKFGEEYEDNDYVSCSFDGKPHSFSPLNACISKLCKKLGLPHITVHGLRHMCATILLENSSIVLGENLAKISAFLGHKSIHTTFKYYCEVMDDKEKILSFMNDLFVVPENV